MKQLLSYCLIVLVCFSLLSSCQKQNDSEFIYYLDSEPITLDPQTVYDRNGEFMVLNLFQGLISLTEEGELVPASAETYSYDKDTLTYTFNLREGLLWSDGRKLTANDFVFAFRRLLSPQTKSKSTEYFLSIKNAEKVLSGEMPENELGVFAVSENILKITLSYPDYDFLKSLTHPAAMPCNEEFFLSTKGKYGLEYDTVITNGAFKITSWHHDKSAFLVKNEKHYNLNEIPQSVKLIIDKEGSLSLSEFKEKNNVLLKSSVMLKDFTDKNSIKQEVLDKYTGILFNSESEIFSDKRLREVLSASFNRESYKSILSENYEIDDSFIFSETFSYNPEYAKNLLSALESDIKREDLNKTKIISLKGSVDKELISYAVQVWQKDLSLYFGITELSEKDYYEALSSGNFDIAIVSYNGKQTKDISILNSFASASNFNYSNLNSEVFDETLLDYKSSFSKNEAETYLNYSKEYLKNEYLYIPAYKSYSYIYKQKNVKNLFYNPEFSVHDFSTAEN